MFANYSDNGDHAQMTKRELEVLSLFNEKRTLEEIAVATNTSTRTAAALVKRVIEKISRTPSRSEDLALSRRIVIGLRSILGEVQLHAALNGHPIPKCATPEGEETLVNSLEYLERIDTIIGSIEE